MVSFSPDCLAITHTSPSNLFGLESLVKKIDKSKKPKIAYCLTNIAASSTDQQEPPSMEVDVVAESRRLIGRLKANGSIISPKMASSPKPTPINLYFKVCWTCTFFSVLSDRFLLPAELIESVTDLEMTCEL